MAEHYVIIGSGIAGVTAAEVLRSEDSAAQISLITDDRFPPYYRPALKDYLAGRVHEDKLWSRPTDFYQEQQVRLITGHAVAIQAGQHQVQLHDGAQVGYSRLLVACGARASRLNCPGSNLAGVTTLRSIADYQEMQQRLAQTRRIVVTGSGTLALETIETLRHRNYEVTHLLRKQVLWSEVLDPTASDLVLQQERRDGVDVRVGEEIAEISGKNGQVAGIITSSGARIACEMVIMAIGIEPDLALLKKSGIPCGRGVKVDATMRTGAPDIYAAGDVLEITDSQTGRTRILGQWYPAIQQARTAAYSMLDLLDSSQPGPGSLFYNATCLYGLDLAAAGQTQIPANSQGYQAIVADPEPRVYRKAVLKDGKVVGMLTLGNRQGALALKRAIDHNVNIQTIAGRLFASDFDLNSWLDQQGVPTVSLHSNRAGAVSVRRAAAQGETVARQREIALTSLGEAWLIATGTASEGNAMASTPLSQTRVMTIGRQEGIYLLIDHGSVSRRHAEISYDKGQYLLRDLDSSNGTFINDTRLERDQVHMLQANERIRFGKSAPYLFQARVLKAEKAAQSEKTVTVRPTQQHPMGTAFYDPNASANVPATSYQPALNASGELLMPGANRPIPPEVVATFATTPVLIAVQRGVPVVLSLQQQKNLSVGREKSCDLVLADVSVSRKHAEIIPGADGFYVRDMQSSNGVVVNQAKIENPYRLTHGDRISIGSASIYFFYQSPTMFDAPAPASPSQAVCQHCSQPNSPEARFCARCGYVLQPQPAAVLAGEEEKHARR